MECALHADEVAAVGGTSIVACRCLHAAVLSAGRRLATTFMRCDMFRQSGWRAFAQATRQSVYGAAQFADGGEFPAMTASQRADAVQSGYGMVIGIEDFEG